MADSIKQDVMDFIERLRNASSTVVLTGAGVSTDSGIPDFRGPSGLYSKISQRTFEIDFFQENPIEYYKIAIDHIHTLADKEPNPTHHMLSQLETQGLIKAIITQNIDGLHKKAGSQNIIEFHGDVTRFYCMECEKEFNRIFVEDQIRIHQYPSCDSCGALIRPGIVFFGDAIPMDAMYDSQLLAQTSDYFVTMGSSLTVNPAASLATLACQTGAELCIINRGPTNLDGLADLRIEADLKTFSENVIKEMGL